MKTIGQNPSNTTSLANPMRTCKITRVTMENYRVNTIEIGTNLEVALPGQFLMVWIPGHGEKPMSIGNSSPLTISVSNIGHVSAALCSLKTGDRISFRGPFGKSFEIAPKAKRILVVGGGYGVVPVYFLSKRAKQRGVEAVAIVGGRTEADIIYEKRLASVCRSVLITTDDGSKGRKGNVMVEVEPAVKSGKFDCVYTCGPERMMYAVAKTCSKFGVPCQVSVERYMKCGVGVCGSCAIDGKFACVDGPVLDAEEALALKEFGKQHRDASGLLHDW